MWRYFVDCAWSTLEKGKRKSNSSVFSSLLNMNRFESRALLSKSLKWNWVSANEKTTSGLSNYLKVLSKAFSVFTLLLSSFSHPLPPPPPFPLSLVMIVREWRTKPRPCQSITKQHYQSTGRAQVSSGDWRVQDWWGRLLCICAC